MCAHDLSSGNRKKSPTNPPRSLTRDLDGAAESDELRKEVERLRMYNKVLVRGIKRMQQPGENVPANFRPENEDTAE